MTYNVFGGTLKFT